MLMIEKARLILAFLFALISGMEETSCNLKKSLISTDVRLLYYYIMITLS